MMAAQPVPHQTTDKRRVKVYELRHNDWFDRGTGFCCACFLQVEEGQPKEPRVIVDSEDHPNRRLLETKIVKEDGFQKQQDTLIVWTDNGVDMALSFQEADGCAAIWRFIDGVQQTFQGGMAGPDDSLSDDLTMEMPAPIQLPPPELGSLHELDLATRNLSQSPAGRDALAKAIMNEDYIGKLVPLVDMAEDLESLEDLHRLCTIMKTFLLLNDTSIIEHAVSDECVLGVVGALEYDPDFPSHKANHRQWLNNQGRYKEVVKIQDERVRRKIHTTYRLQYLKDVVLARILDDPTFSVLNSLIFFAQVDIVSHLNDTPGFMHELFAIFPDPREPPLRKKEAVLFIQQCCAVAKNLQPPGRQALYVHFLKEGLLPAINYGMRHRDVSVRVGATDILVSMIDHDPSLVRQTIYEQIYKKSPPITDTLIDLLLVEVDLGVKSQVSEALKVLLDPCPSPLQQQQQQEGRGEFINGQPRLRAPPGIDPQQDEFLEQFYGHSAVRLFKPLLDLEKRTEMKFSPLEEGIFGYLNDILCFYIQRHHHRSKFFVLTHNLASRFVQLLACKEKHMQLVAVRFFRHLVVMQDEFYVKQMADKQVLGPILDVLLRTLPRDNLLCSACLELFMLINKENIKELIKQMVENYREKVMALAYMDTFNEIINRYDQTQGFTTNIDPYFESEDELGRRPPNGAARGMMEHLVVDQAQEDYWNMSDDEDELPGSQHPHEPEEMPLRSPNGTGAAGSKPLVEYNSDDDDDDDENVVPDEAGGDAVMASSADALPNAATLPSSSPPSAAAATTTAPGGDETHPPSEPSSSSTAAAVSDGTPPSQPPISTGAPSSAPTSSPTSAPTSTPSSSPTTASTSSSTSAAAASAAAAAAAAAPPPERLSEKRRREEDEDDALAKLTQHKRRNSSSVASNSSSTAAIGTSSTSAAVGVGGTLRKTRSFSGSAGGQGRRGASPSTGGGTGGGGGGAGAKKIAISISPAAVKNAVRASGEEGGGGAGGGEGE